MRTYGSAAGRRVTDEGHDPIMDEAEAEDAATLPVKPSSLTQVGNAADANSGITLEENEDRTFPSVVETPEDSRRDTTVSRTGTPVLETPSKADGCTDVLAETEDDGSAMKMDPAVVKRLRGGETKDSDGE